MFSIDAAVGVELQSRSSFCTTASPPGCSARRMSISAPDVGVGIAGGVALAPCVCKTRCDACAVGPPVQLPPSLRASVADGGGMSFAGLVDAGASDAPAPRAPALSALLAGVSALPCTDDDAPAAPSPRQAPLALPPAPSPLLRPPPSPPALAAAVVGVLLAPRLLPPLSGPLQRPVLWARGVIARSQPITSSGSIAGVCAGSICAGSAGSEAAAAAAALGACVPPLPPHAAVSPATSCARRSALGRWSRSPAPKSEKSCARSGDPMPPIERRSIGESWASCVRRYVASVGGTGDPATTGTPEALVTTVLGGAWGAEGIWMLRLFCRLAISGGSVDAGFAAARPLFVFLFSRLDCSAEAFFRAAPPSAAPAADGGCVLLALPLASRALALLPPASAPPAAAPCASARLRLRASASKRFLTALSVRPPTRRASSVHRLPSRACPSSRVASSSGDHDSVLLLAFRWLPQRRRHCLGPLLLACAESSRVVVVVGVGVVIGGGGDGG